MQLLNRMLREIKTSLLDVIICGMSPLIKFGEIIQ